jgi:DEAD/DEAH box helicase domain-containing protein
MEIAGQSVPQQGFVVCRTCGKVQDPRAGNGPQHTPYCRAKLGKVPEEMSAIYLGRSLNSEALRVLLPVTSVELTKSLATFEAALQLGLRKHFGGQPAHLRLVSATEPAHNEELQFIVIYDSVPGGTGYLADLAKPENFRAVVEKAHAAMRDCECAEGEQQKDGCYKCVLAYQHSRNIANISRRDGLARFGQILAQWDELGACSTLSEVDASSAVESELEMKFLEALRGPRAARRRAVGDHLPRRARVLRAGGEAAPLARGAAGGDAGGPRPHAARLWGVPAGPRRRAAHGGVLRRSALPRAARARGVTPGRRRAQAPRAHPL